jgi:hypothetical protein
LGSGLSLAATSSKPGMFLYPIRQTTQKFTGTTEAPTTSLPSTIEVPQDSENQPPSANVDTPIQDIQGDVAEEPEITQPGQKDEATASPAPTPARIVDEITATVEPEAVPSADLDSIANTQNSPANEQLSGSSHDGQPESSHVDELGDGQAGKDQRSDNDNSHSESSHDDGSNDNGKGNDD